MKRKLIVLFAVLLFAALFLPNPIAAQGNVVEIGLGPRFPAHTVSSSDSVVVRMSWVTGSPGTVRAFINAVHQELYVNDVLVVASPAANGYWGPIVSSPNTFPEYFNQNLPISMSTWRYPLGQLAVGTYRVSLVSRTDHPITDISDANGDGHPDPAAVWESTLGAVINVQ